MSSRLIGDREIQMLIDRETAETDPRLKAIARTARFQLITAQECADSLLAAGFEGSEVAIYIARAMGAAAGAGMALIVKDSDDTAAAVSTAIGEVFTESLKQIVEGGINIRRNFTEKENVNGNSG